MMLAKANAIMLMSELLKIQEKVCEQQDDVIERYVKLYGGPLYENLKNESYKLDELEDIIEETLSKLDTFVKTME